MKSHSEYYELKLDRGCISAAPAGQHTQIRCINGSVWITLDNDTRDIVLEEGETFNAAEHMRLLIYAFEESCIAVTSSSGAIEPSGHRAHHVPKYGRQVTWRD